MGILNIASNNSIYRGYCYCEEGKVISCERISINEYSGKVKGSNITPYDVLINIDHPKMSSCSCLFANGNRICKHMVALYFYALPEELKEYEECLESEDEEYDEYDIDSEYDECCEEYYNNRYNEYDNRFLKPLFFDDILKNFVNNLTEDEAKAILLKRLKQNESYTFNTYLKNEYRKYMLDEDNILVMLEIINKRLYKLSKNCDYNYMDYTISLLTSEEKKKLIDVYNRSKTNEYEIDKILLNPKLAIYDDYKWIALFYKNKNDIEKLKEYCKRLQDFLYDLKIYNIKNSTPKANVMTIIYILEKHTLDEIAELLIKNSKYEEYIEYVINNTENVKLLYDKFYEILKKQIYVDKENIVKVFLEFYKLIEDDNIYYEGIYYMFLSKKDKKYLEILKESKNFDNYIDRIMLEHNDILKEKIYVFLNKKKDLFLLLSKRGYEYKLIDNIEFLKDNYNDELYIIFKKCFFEILEENKNRETYKKAAVFISAISKLNNGKELVNDFILQLKNFKYSKRSALFEEIHKVIN